MSAEHEIATPAPLARLEAASPWQGALPAGRLRGWLAALATAWRDGAALYVRAIMVRGHWPGWF